MVLCISISKQVPKDDWQCCSNVSVAIFSKCWEKISCKPVLFKCEVVNKNVIAWGLAKIVLSIKKVVFLSKHKLALCSYENWCSTVLFGFNILSSLVQCHFMLCFLSFSTFSTFFAHCGKFSFRLKLFPRDSSWNAMIITSEMASITFFIS